MYKDYHVHTCFSRDSGEKIANYVKKAHSVGVDEICFTDHIDFDLPYEEEGFSFDPVAQVDAIRSTKSPIALKCGVEFGLRDDLAIMQAQEKYLAAANYDFIIGSVHCVDGVDPWFSEFFSGRTRRQGFERYVRQIYDCVKIYDGFCSLGHIDYPIKGCPYDDKRLRLTDAPDIIDGIFSLLISRGKCMELNTSVLKKLGGARYHPEVLKRYVELGGTYVTIGSDSHNADSLGYRFGEVHEFAKQCGVKYVATFSGMKPEFIRL